MIRLPVFLLLAFIGLTPTAYALSPASQALADKYGEHWGDKHAAWLAQFNNQSPWSPSTGVAPSGASSVPECPPATHWTTYENGQVILHAMQVC